MYVFLWVGSTGKDIEEADRNEGLHTYMYVRT